MGRSIIGLFSSESGRSKQPTCVRPAARVTPVVVISGGSGIRYNRIIFISIQLRSRTENCQHYFFPCDFGKHHLGKGKHGDENVATSSSIIIIFIINRLSAAQNYNRNSTR